MTSDDRWGGRLPGLIDKIVFTNRLDLPLTVFRLDDKERQLPATLPERGETFTVPAQGKGDLLGGEDGRYIVLTAASGARVCTIDANERGMYTITYGMLTKPHDIGPFPEPTAEMLIPADSPRVLVACGHAPPVRRRSF
ncbi:hypothetical protein ACIBQ1_60840 [Nonomuraea sp. NPDC050153]|uniref:hypothetical protein n=1 Tax=Nonomuraea sp. NPDC050153 TaxID=3364359 RepID=UPI0037AECA32